MINSRLLSLSIPTSLWLRVVQRAFPICPLIRLPFLMVGPVPRFTPWPPIGDREAEAAAVASVAPVDVDAADHGLVDGLFDAPIVLALLADLTRVVGTDRDLGRYTLVAGASIYPFAWSILVGARSEGLGGVMPTILTRQEPAMRDLLGVPDHFALAAVMMLGHPVRQPTKLRRDPVESFVTVDHFDGDVFGG